MTVASVRIVTTRRTTNSPDLLQEVERVIRAATGAETVPLAIASSHVDNGAFLAGALGRCNIDGQITVVVAAEGILIGDAVDFMSAMTSLEALGDGKVFLLYADTLSQLQWKAIRNRVRARNAYLINLALVTDAWQETLTNWLLCHQP